MDLELSLEDDIETFQLSLMLGRFSINLQSADIWFFSKVSAKIVSEPEKPAEPQYLYIILHPSFYPL